MTTAPRPGAGAPRHYEFPHTERVTLDNGLRVVVANIPRLPLVTVLALVDAGSSNDPSGREGVASLTARALTEGTTRLDGASLALEMERLGSGIDSGSDWDEAMVHLTVMPTRLERAMTVMGDVLMTPSFAPRDVERLRAERLADLLQQQVEPRSLAHDKFSEVLFVAGSRYGVPSSGRTATVAHLDAEAVRAFHAARYGPHTTTLIFSGDVTLERAVALAHATLGAWTQTTVSPVAIDDQPRHEGRRVHLVHKSDAPQTELRVGHGGVPRRHLDYFPITVMNALLGGLFSSRINLNLREKNGYTYGDAAPDPLWCRRRSKPKSPTLRRVRFSMRLRACERRRSAPTNFRSPPHSSMACFPFATKRPRPWPTPWRPQRRTVSTRTTTRDTASACDR